MPIPARISATFAIFAAVIIGGCGPGETRTVSGTVPRPFIGIQAPDLATGAPAALQRDVAAAAVAGAGTLRQPVFWATTEPAPGQYDMTALDAIVEAAARHRMGVLPMLVGTPLWALPPDKVSSAAQATGPPADMRTLSSFATTLVGRYGPEGSFWREHPNVPRKPIRAWQVWNEPNLPQYWFGHPDARAYARMLRIVGRAIHRADPHAEVVSAGIPNSRQGIPFTRWVAEFFAGGGQGTFDAFALHGYAASVDGLLSALGQTRSLLDAHGAKGVPIRLTEFGWADAGPLSAFTVSARTQAFDVRTALTELAARHRQLGLEGIVYFSLRDGASAREANRGWGYYTGLLTSTGQPKPAYRAFGTAAREITRR